MQFKLAQTDTVITFYEQYSLLAAYFEGIKKRAIGAF